jgi:malate dehydrogenase (quinone)
MSATLGTLLKQVNPNLTIRVFERLNEVAEESSNPWNNAGTGHAALCELNYMPDSADGSLPNPSKAIAINEQFQVSRQFWASLVQRGILHDPVTFIHSCPHMTFVRGAGDVDYLKRRHQALVPQPLFAGMEYSEDPIKIAQWAPLLMERRRSAEPVAATYIDSGTDVDFGAITKQLFENLAKNGTTISTGCEVKGLKRTADGWNVSVSSQAQKFTVDAKFVFVGAGGYALKLLQKSRIPEADGYGTFPVSGSFYRTDNPILVAKHQAKVYSQAAVGAPPMSVPHLDTRIVDGKASLLFGPYAGANPKFLKTGSILDLPLSVRLGNLIPYLSVAVKNLGLIKYLVTEVLKSKRAKFDSLRDFVPSANRNDWYLIEAGQRAQVIKKDAQKGGVLQFGTEVVAAADGSIAGLLGASPGASTAVPIMLDVLKKAFPGEYDGWVPAIKQLIPYYGLQLNEDSATAARCLSETSTILKLR